MKKLLYFQTLILTGGTIFAWYTIFGDFDRFFNAGGKLLQFSGCRFPNPLATPCFYGGIAFIIALVWSINLIQVFTLNSQKHLTWLLFGGTIFAWSMVGKEFYTFFQKPVGGYFGCTGLPAQNPVFTPCFTGASIYLIAFIFSIIAIKLLDSKGKAS